MSHFRVDRGTLRPRRRMADGRLRVDAHVTRSGVFTYILPNGTRQREYRPDSEVFDEASIDSLRAVIVTDDHPTEPISVGNVKQYGAGQLGESVRRDGDHVAATLYVSDPSLISKMENGKRDVSCGYRCDIEKTPGISPTGEPYDVVQRNISYNHVAIVEVGRAGSARVRMDAAQQVYEDQENSMSDKDKRDDGDNALRVAASRLAAAEEKAASAETRADVAEGRVTALEEEVKSLRSQRQDANLIAEKDSEIEKQKKRADSAERALAGVPERIKEAVARRVKLEKDATEVLGGVDSRGQKLRLDDMSDRDIMVMTVEKLHGTSIESERSDDYARARFDAAVEGFRAGSVALSRIREEVQHRDDAAGGARRQADARTLREDATRRTQEAWRQPLPSTHYKNPALVGKDR